MKWEGRDVVVNDINEFEEMSWSQYLDYMFSKIQEDSTLLVGIKDEDPFDEHYDRTHILKCGMEWYRGDPAKVKEPLQKLIDDLRALSKYWNELQDEDTDEEELLKETGLYDAWKRYLKPLPDVEMLDAAVRERVGTGVNAYGVLYRARRVCQLYALGAKPVIIANEERNLAQAFAIHRYCSEMECVDKVN